MRKTKKSLFKIVLSLTVVLSMLAVIYFGGVSLIKTLYPLDYVKFVEREAENYGLEKSFVFAVIECESGFDKNAVSGVGARGLMQIMPETFDWLLTKTNEELDQNQLFDPQVSIKYGCLLFSILIKEFKNEETAIAAYHAGFGNVRKWLADERYSSDGETLETIPFPSTAQYVKKVINVQKIYNKLYGSLLA